MNWIIYFSMDKKRNRTFSSSITFETKLKKIVALIWEEEEKRVKHTHTDTQFD